MSGLLDCTRWEPQLLHHIVLYTCDVTTFISLQRTSLLLAAALPPSVQAHFVARAARCGAEPVLSLEAQVTRC